MFTYRSRELRRKDTYEQWIKRVDAILAHHVGLVHDDLPDTPTRQYYDDGLSPAEGARRVLRKAKELL